MSLYKPSLELDALTLQVARYELNESCQQQCVKDIDYIREWIKQQCHLESRIDDEFLLSFLRAAKFDFMKTKQLIENFWSNRTNFKDIFHDRCLGNNSKLIKIAKLGLLVPLLKLDDEKRRVVIQRPGLWDTLEFSYEDLVKYLFVCMDILCEDPISQINGV
jgi:hypothetical protein